MTEDTLRFDFGRNWASYVARALDPAREEAARQSVANLVGADDLRGRTFLDLGSGSGVFSLAAFRMGATVTSLDLDPMSVECCKQLREAAGASPRWTVLQGSILDDAAIARLPQADIVYSWGVLHHTGQMWRAITLAASRVAPGGLLCIAIYNRVESRVTGSDTWRRIKRTYVSQPRPIRMLMEWGYGAYKSAALLVTLRNPFKVAKAYRRERGMSLWHDWVDWLGGYPYEFASPAEIFDFGRATLGFELIRMRTTSSLGCNEFVFRRPASASAPARV